MNTLRKALFRALEKSDLNMLRAVLAQGVSLAYEAGDPDPVCFAAAHTVSDLAMLQCLHDAGADVKAREPQYQDSLLHWAVKAEDDRILPWLIEQGLDVNAVNARSRTPLFFAVPAMAVYAEPDELIVSVRDIQVLLAAGASVNVIDADTSTPLRQAAIAGAAEVVAVLLSHGADVHARRADGCTALHLIGLLAPDDIRDSHLAVIDQLLATGADLEARDEDGWTPLIAAAAHNNLPVFEHLLQRGADPEAGDGNVLRLLMIEGSDPLLDRLLGEDVAIDRPFGDEVLRPLGVAAHNGYLYGVQTLLDRGADIEAETIDGETALLMAVRKREHDVVAHLLSRGANRHHADHYNNTPLSWAQRRGDARLIELLSA
ncbi:hypothetical protein ABAC460_05985 [Asticcacaulis sp. AC460]|uniref:ankyrin repeat domain-containing protein n=1 Tax=Asticcacaulis sp. AC460 TaxID=1282360 RepID=UPI0003C3BDF7|nr:ankyrin repeat domain-containing protein [Asticcacaulis sp. AC460]ESQ91532.1 hypothetical protein ABAC460_05985 [Asticcacaulis sp. AC460]